MRATIIFEDNLDTGAVDITGTVDGLPPDAMPSGAQIMFAYMNTHVEEISLKAQAWFKTELTSRVSKVLHDE